VGAIASSLRLVAAAAILLAGSATAARSTTIENAALVTFASLEDCVPDSTCDTTRILGDTAALAFSNVAGFFLAKAWTTVGASNVIATATGHTDAVPGQSRADAYWYAGVRQTSPTPVPVVGDPLIITGSLKTKVNLTPVGDDPVGSAVAYASALVHVLEPTGVLAAWEYAADSYCSDSLTTNLLGMTTSVLQCGSNSVPSTGFSVATTSAIGVSMYVSVDAAGAADPTGDSCGCGSGPDAMWSARADPTIIIDPSFPYANDFQVFYSPQLYTNMLAPSVPEPSSMALLAGSLLLFAGCGGWLKRPLRRPRDGRAADGCRPDSTAGTRVHVCPDAESV